MTAPAAPAAPPLPLTRRHRYQVLATIGEGASAAVLKVLDRELDEVIALKVLAAEVAGNRAVVERLKAEIRIARRVRHPNVARVYDLEEWDGRLCISMEHIDGENLERHIDRAPLPWSRAVPLLTTLAHALESAHGLGVVHRDLKPANILLDANGHPYILDFGIALGPGTPTEDGDVIRGSPAYMAPERWRGVPGLPASDLYSLGVLGHEAMTGKTPYEAASVRLLMSQHLHAPIPRLGRFLPDVPPALEALLSALLAKRPEERPSSAEAIGVLRRLQPRREWAGAGGESRGKVLIVEDESLIRSLLAELLRRRGATVLEARDGHEGIRLAQEGRPDLVLLDITMPGLDGVSTLRALKSSPEMSGRPVVMLSGSLDPEHPALSRELGAAAFLNKPINTDVLDLVLDKYLG